MPDLTTEDSDSSLVTNPSGSPGNISVIALTTGGPGENNHTFDTGLCDGRTFASHRIWFDTNNDGR